MIHLLMQAKQGTLQADDNATATGKTIKPSMCKKELFLCIQMSQTIMLYHGSQCI